MSCWLLVVSIMAMASLVLARNPLTTFIHKRNTNRTLPAVAAGKLSEVGHGGNYIVWEIEWR